MVHACLPRLWDSEREDCKLNLYGAAGKTLSQNMKGPGLQLSVTAWVLPSVAQNLSKKKWNRKADTEPTAPSEPADQREVR